VTSVLAILVVGAAAVRSMSLPPAMPDVMPIPAAAISPPLPVNPAPAAPVEAVVTGPKAPVLPRRGRITEAPDTANRPGRLDADAAGPADAEPEEPIAASRAIAPTVTSAIPRVTFTQVPLVFDARMLVRNGDDWTEREATLLLADRVTFTANNNLLESIPYSGVQSVSYARGRQPLVATPAGPEPVVKVGGAFGFLRGERNWITLHTANGFVVMRVDDDRLNPVLKAIQERTGRRIDHVTVRKDDR
jgi:hypothetical protein